MPNVIIQCHNVCKRYSSEDVIRNISFNIDKGERVLILGANGAGKTTLFHLLLGLLQPTSGSIVLKGIKSHLPQARQGVGVVLQQSEFMRELTVIETIHFVKKHYKHTFEVDEVVALFCLDKFTHQFTDTLSLGQQRRLALALAIIHQPSILFLDEPTVGLDVLARESILSWLNQFTLQNSKTVVFTTHFIDEAELLADRIIYLKKGRITFDGSISSFKNAHMKTMVCFFCYKLVDFSFLEPTADIVSIENHYVVLMTLDADALLRDLVSFAIPFSQLQVIPSTMEQVCLSRFRSA